MSPFRLLVVVGLGGLTALAGGVGAEPPMRAGAEKPAEQPFHKELLKIAADYKSWGRVDDEMRWAPWLCRTPNPGLAHVSASKDEQTHGQKLYSLFARQRDDYVKLAKGKTVAVGQAIVKQSWLPDEITDPKERPGKQIDGVKVVLTPAPDAKDRQLGHLGDHFYPYVWKGEKVFKATQRAELFIMMKLAPGTPGTDAGWVYATATPDGKKITSVGKVASCMRCHVDPKRDRLFGLAK
jgi:hypothetical protein